MTKYVAEILKKIGIDYQEHNIQDHCNDESGETWITLHPKKDWQSAANLIDKLESLSQSAFGNYKIYWDEHSCYFNIVGVLEINSDGVQVFPLPTQDKPALFSQKHIQEMWKMNKGLIYDAII